MYPAHYWFAAAIFIASLGLWRATKDRSRLRMALGFLSLWAVTGISVLLPASWRPADAVVVQTAAAFIELAAVQIGFVLVFDLLLARVSIPKFVSELLVVAAYIAIVFNLLYQDGVNVTGIFATSAVAAAVIGFALQDMLSNIAGGIALEMEGEVTSGEFIQCGEWMGATRHVRLRHTVIRSPEGETVILPNSYLTRTPVRVHGKPWRRHIRFYMPYSTDPHDLMAAVEFALRASPITGVASDPAPLCVVQEMQPGQICYAAVVWLTDPMIEYAVTSDVRMRVYYALKRAGLPVTEITTVVDVQSPAEALVKALDPVDALRRTPILRLLDDPDLFQLASHLQSLSFAAGEYIIRQGEPGASMYFIVEGKVQISLRSSDGVERHVSSMDAGDFFGEASLLTGEARSASAIAVTKVQCYMLDKSGLQGFIKRLPELAEDMSVVMAHRQMELDTVRDKLDRETALRREAENQTQLLKRIRRFFET
ncbi:MAG: mechanosensitive ion channel [Acidobacteriota bacterium]|nr:mechanosensitive ion channel [Acidobacteriota bacterium]